MKTRNLIATLAAGVLAASPAYSQTILFQDDFTSTGLGGSEDNWNVYRTTTTSVSETKFIEVTDVNSGTYLGQAGDNYLRFYKENTSGSLWVTASNRFANGGSPVVTVEFDFHIPTREGVWQANPDPRIRLGVNDPIASNANRVPGEIRFGQGGDGAISSTTDVYSPDTAQSIRIVYNHSSADVAYIGGTREIASSSYDVWIDGQWKFSSASGLSTTNLLALDTPITSIGFGGFNGSDGEMFIDNMTVYSGAIPEPSTYALFGGLAVLAVTLVRRRSR